MTFIWDEFIDTTVNINSLSIQSLYDKNKDIYKTKKMVLCIITRQFNYTYFETTEHG